MDINKQHQIVRLTNTNIEVARRIKALHDSAYKVEAALLEIGDFPPLRKTLESYVSSQSEFFGFIEHKHCLGTVEIASEASPNVEVESLVVDPTYSRRGIATALMVYVMDIAGLRRVSVSTASANYPAINLYQGLGFRIVDQWVTDEQIPIVQLDWQ